MGYNVGHCRSKGIGGNADDKNYKCSRIIHLLNRITSALIVAMLLLGAVKICQIMAQKLRVFEFQINGEREWVAAYTFIHAIQIHSGTSGMDIVEYDSDDEIVEVPESKWDESFITYPDDDQQPKSFSQFIKECNGKAEFMASTAY